MSKAEKDTAIHSGLTGVSMCLTEERAFEWFLKDG